MLKSLAIAAPALVAIVTPAVASSPDAWAEFASRVEQACLGATANTLPDATASVDPFGSESYGLAVVTGNTSTGNSASIICVFDKRTEAVEIGSEIVPVPLSVPGLADGATGHNILQPLDAADIEAASLGGELACSFSSNGDAPLFFATGIVASDDPAQAVVKIDGSLQRFTAPGGFNPIVHGAAFAGEDADIDITVTGQPAEAGESPARPATLAMWPTGGSAFRVTGMWSCGP